MRHVVCDVMWKSRAMSHTFAHPYLLYLIAGILLFLRGNECLKEIDKKNLLLDKDDPWSHYKREEFLEYVKNISKDPKNVFFF